jgi:hypothetical protein
VIGLSEGNFLGSLSQVAQESRISRRLPWPRSGCAHDDLYTGSCEVDP